MAKGKGTRQWVRERLKGCEGLFLEYDGKLPEESKERSGANWDISMWPVDGRRGNAETERWKPSQ